MIAIQTYSLPFCEMENSDELAKNAWLVILHASRIPPHVGLMINGNYNSLTIKERELNVDINALVKTIAQKKIESVFIKIAKHPVFSEDHLLNIFQEQLQQFESVKQGGATCLSPVKLFFEEFYAMKSDNKLLFEFVEAMNENAYIDKTLAVNVRNKAENNIFTFSSYTADELQERIKQERAIYIKH